MQQPPAPPEIALLVWSSSHWASTQKGCRYCGRPTNLRDDEGKAAHKTCAETAMQQHTWGAVDAYRLGGGP